MSRNRINQTVKNGEIVVGIVIYVDEKGQVGIIYIPCQEKDQVEADVFHNAFREADETLEIGIIVEGRVRVKNGGRYVLRNVTHYKEPERITT